MTIEYERISDYDIPTLRLENQNEYQMGFFGRRYKDYLKEIHTFNSFQSTERVLSLSADFPN